MLILKENTIKKWLNEESPRQELLGHSIPQKVLEYSDEPVFHGSYFLSTIDTHVNHDPIAIEDGNAEEFVSGYSAILAGLDFQKIKYFAPVCNHLVKGYYAVKSINAVDKKDLLKYDYNQRVAEGKNVTKYKSYDKYIRIQLELLTYKKLGKPFVYGLDSNASKGVALTRKEFYE